MGIETKKNNKAYHFFLGPMAFQTKNFLPMKIDRKTMVVSIHFHFTNQKEDCFRYMYKLMPPQNSENSCSCGAPKN
jgi:hypothetical protein